MTLLYTMMYTRVGDTVTHPVVYPGRRLLHTLWYTRVGEIHPEVYPDGRDIHPEVYPVLYTPEVHPRDIHLSHPEVHPRDIHLSHTLRYTQVIHTFHTP